MLLPTCVCMCVCHKRDTFGIRHCDLGTSRHMFDWASVALHSARPHAPSATPCRCPRLPRGLRLVRSQSRCREHNSRADWSAPSVESLKDWVSLNSQNCNLKVHDLCGSEAQLCYHAAICLDRCRCAGIEVWFGQVKMVSFLNNSLKKKLSLVYFLTFSRKK